ncbi:fibronectin type III domain-containing protein [uncultured Algibacter sp.]|uniref:fibronectin type III domain-containing protein n=1 Tax=uncultured Algibacter sp. TaxID=298659 RepID=UPI00260F856B|nr:fibronectin type III domain-containing protein [uncultured Algibacter sp.]
MSNSQSGPWEKASNSSKVSYGKTKSSIYSLRVDDFEQKLKKITASNPEKISFPTEDGQSLEFMLYETKVMHPLLENKFPHIKSFKGVSTSPSKKTIAFTYSSKTGFYGVFESNIYEKTEIKPLSNSLYEFTITSSQENDAPFSCETEDYVRNQFSGGGVFDRNVDDGNLRRYRLALSVSGDYSQVFLDGSETNDSERKAKVLQAMVGSVNRLNGIFERDFGITMQLIPNSDLLIYLDPLRDPYTTGSSLRGQLVSTLNATMSNDDYDVGHLFHKESNRKYGNAGCIACVCKDGEKGQAYSVHGSPDSDDMNLLAAHEFGHQFGAYHTQSSSNCRSGINSEVEPGSGSTIMSYAGICPPNVQSGADDYFNYTSIRDVANWTINNSSCAELIPTSNSAPVIIQGMDYSIPRSTPFVLEGRATDVDGNEMLTYCWEQNDNENPGNSFTPRPTNVVGPMFRSLPPSSSNKRYFPNLDDVLINNLTPTWEVLPSVSRTLNFVMTVRDNDVSGGQTVSDAIAINVEGSAGPFNVTSQTENSEVWTVGDLVTVNWNVAGTDSSPINTSQVEIFLSTDGGQSFPNSLIVTDNDGTETFNLPDVDASSNARLMVKAVNNVFFAVNQVDFTIQKSEYVILSNEPYIDACSSGNAVFNVEYKTFLTFDEEVIVSDSNLPDGTSASFSQDTFNGTNTEGSNFVVTVSGLDNLDSGDYSFTVEGISESNIKKNITLGFTVFLENEVILNLVSPIDNADSEELDLELIWENDNNSISYQIEIATDEAFNNIVEDALTTETIFVPSSLENNQLYYWRVQSLNPCGASSFSATRSFSTACNTPENITSLTTDINSIEIAWEDSSSSSSWTVEYGVSGFLIGTGVSSIEDVKQFRAEGLESGTKYDFYVASNCSVGGSSSFIGPFIISTEADYCNGDHFYDSGGADGNYTDNENITTQIYPDNSSDRVRVRFDSFNVHYNFDFLTIFNGEDDTGAFLGSFTGNQLIGQEFASTHDSGALTFVFYSNSFLNFSGWDAVVSCEEKPNCFEPVNFETTEIKGDEASFSWNAVGSDSSWELEYEESGFVRGNGTIVTALEESIIIENLTPLTSYEVYIKTICDAGGYSEILGPYRFVTTELCSTPIDLNVTSFTNDTAVISWGSPNLNVNTWEVEYGARGFTLGSGSTQSVTEKTATLNDLVSNSEYEFYVRSNCEVDGDGYSNWAGPIRFTTTPDYCSGDHFYDSGGPTGNYSNGENTTTTIHPKTMDERVRVVFNSFLVESCCDRLRIYDGPDTQSPLLGTYRSNPGMLVSTHESGALTFLFTSDGSVTSFGWDATVICEEKPNCVTPTSFAVSNIESKQVDLSWQQPDSENSWTIEYGERGFILGGGTEIMANTTNKTITDLTPDTDYEAYIKANCTVGGYSDVQGPIQFTTPVACFIPQNLRSVSVATTSTNVTWDTSTSGENEWEIEYGNKGFLLDTGTRISLNTNSGLIENLTPNTEYDIYVRANCNLDGYSQWSSVLTLKTNCNVISAPYKESFVNTNIIPDCWEESNNGNWSFNTYASSEASNVQDRSSLKNSNYAWLDGSLNAFNGDYILKSPWVDVSTLSNPAITFSAFSKNTLDNVYNELNVTLSDSNGTSFTDVITVNSNTHIWKDFVIDLSDYGFTSNEIQVEFKITLDQSFSKRYNDILIDEVSFDELPSCTNPVNPVVANITGKTAELSWESTDDETDWEIQYGFTGFTIAGATTVFTTENPFVISDLVPERSYDVYIRAVCGIGDSSEFIGPITFSTTESCITPTNFSVNSFSSNSAELIWDNNGNATEWEVEYSTISFNPGNGIGTLVTTTTNLVTIENLLPDTWYLLYLRGNCGVDGYSNWTNAIFFKTEESCSRPANFSMQSLTKNSAELVWNDNGDATEWEVEYQAGYFNPGNGIGTIQTTSVNSINIENLLPDTLYYIYLRSDCADGGYSRWTNYVAFRTEVACTIPNGFTEQNVTKNSVELTWSDNGDATEWEVEYYTGYFQPGSGIGTIQTTSVSSISIENLLPDTSYYAYLRSNCDTDGNSNWVGYINFRTEVACFAPDGFTIQNVTENSAELAWDDSENVADWEIEYFSSYFIPGNGIGTEIKASTNSINLEGLLSGRTYYVYLRSNCGVDGYSNWTPLQNFDTLCGLQSDRDDLVVNGSFECGSLAGWKVTGPDIFFDCSKNFHVLENSTTLCSVFLSQILPTDGTYGAFTSFNNVESDITYSLSQNIIIPNDIDNAENAIMSFSFKANYALLYNNPTQERVFTAKFTDLLGVELFQLEEVRFGLSPNSGSIDVVFNDDILSDLVAYAGDTIMLKFSAYMPESNTGPADALIDNVSLVLNETLSYDSSSISVGELSIYPIPNEGQFTIHNKRGGLIEMIEVFDVSGRLIQKEKIEIPSQKVDVSLQNITSGTYFVKVLIEGHKYTKRIVVE